MDAQDTATREELENSVPIDWGRRLCGAAGTQFLNDVLEGLSQANPRQRARRLDDAENHRATVSALLANLLAASLNRVDSSKYIAAPFGRREYSGLRESQPSAVQLRDWLLQQCWIDLHPGYVRWDAVGEVAHSRLTRLRATPKVRAAFRERNLGMHSLTIADEWLLRMDGKPATRQIPPEVEASRHLLRAVNQRLAGGEINLPDEAWERIARRRRAAASGNIGQQASALQFAGDGSALSLYRTFNDDFSKGGRFYGGWWINIPREERLNITIAGQPTVECDYSQLHPALLYCRERIPLRSDPYRVPGFEARSRELAKTTFQRLLNGTIPATLAPERLRTEADSDLKCLPTGKTFSDFVAALIEHNAAIRRWFGTRQYGPLQREDSDLANGVLSAMEKKGIVTLPVHDSFLVQRRHMAALKAAMKEVYMARYKALPLIKHKPRQSVSAPHPPCSITDTHKARTGEAIPWGEK